MSVTVSFSLEDILFVTNRALQSASFDLAAEDYDRFRKPYPKEVIDQVIVESQIPPSGKILEVGCGSGRATIQLAEHGFEILAIDPGKNLLEIAQAKCKSFKSVKFLLAQFETASLPTGQFDLVFSADALHWVNPSVRYTLIAEALREAGHLCILTDSLAPSANNVTSLITEILIRRLEGYSPITHEIFEANIEMQIREIESSGRFSGTRIFRVPQVETFTAAQYAHSLSVWSRILILPASARRELLAEIEATINRNGGSVTQSSEFLVFIAQKHMIPNLPQTLDSVRKQGV